MHVLFVRNMQDLRAKGFCLYMASLRLFVGEPVLVSTDRIEDDTKLPFLSLFLLSAVSR
jgi:hypothetical protein